MSRVLLYVDDEPVSVPLGANVAAAVAQATSRFRVSAGGAPRSAVCGMGVCFECRVRIDSADHQRACMVPARDGMRITTAEAFTAHE